MFSHRSLFMFLVLALALTGLAAGCRPVAVLGSTPDDSRAEVAEAFYYWYLGYAGNPLVEGAYRERPELSQAFIMQVDALLASSEHAMFDPFLCAQDIPEAFDIEALEEGVLVHGIWNAGTGYELVRTVELAFVQAGGMWKIDAILCPAPEAAPPAPTPTGVPTAIITLPPPTAAVALAQPQTAWNTFEDAVYGYRIAYPPGWVPKEVAIRSPELAAPVVQIMVFAPVETIEAMDKPGPPDPTKPPVVPPLNVEVSVGSMDEYRRMYPEPTASETLSINGYVVIKEMSGMPDQPHLIRYIFQSPADASVRVTLTDNISGFEARANGNDAIIDLVGQMLNSFSFGE